jgi:flagellar basal-body rod protein FlgG
MNPALWIAKTGLDAQQTRMSVISNNLANVNTAGFKRDRAAFEDLLYQTVRQPGGATSEQTQLPTGLQLGTGVRVAATAKNFSQGNLNQTGNALDVAINGRGFFEVLMPDGSTAYTRDGSFQINAQGELVTNEGYAVQPGLQLPEGAQSVTIGADGTVSVQVAGQAAPVQVGQLTLSDFVNPAGLEAKGENLYAETAASGPAQSGAPGQGGVGTLVQGALESSNVNVVEELVSMIETQRAYETNAKAISTTDSMLGFLNNNL